MRCTHSTLESFVLDLLQRLFASPCVARAHVHRRAWSEGESTPSEQAHALEADALRACSCSVESSQASRDDQVQRMKYSCCSAKRDGLWPELTAATWTALYLFSILACEQRIVACSTVTPLDRHAGCSAGWRHHALRVRHTRLRL